MAVDSDGTAARVLVVEDDGELSRAIERKLCVEGYVVETNSRAPAVLDRLTSGADWDVVIMDVGLPDISGIDLLAEFRRLGSLASVIMLTADNSAATATTCMRGGAFYYITKPFRPVELVAIVQSATRHTLLRRQLAQSHTGNGSDSLLLGSSAAMRKLRETVARVAGQDVTILIQGESGTGKELVARALHDRSARSKHAFVALNCGAIPEALIDSELFGHAKGAFTGATSDRAGMFVEADHGTLFLDEIGDMPLGVQARLLRVIQEGEVRAVGATGVRSVDVRIIAATHVDLATAVEQGRFRQDLYYRLNTVVLPVPPLRERPDDLPMLAAHFLRKHGGATPPTLSPEALDAIASYGWPGNVRELENALLHAIALHHGDTIGPEWLPLQLAPRAKGSQRIEKPGMTVRVDDTPLPLVEAKRRLTAAYEEEYLINVMERAKGSIAEGARIAGVDRANFRRLLLRHNIDPNRFK